VNSLRLRLIAGVLALVTVIWIVVTVVAWVETRHETNEILDAHLAQAAGLLAAFVGNGTEGANELAEHLPAHRYARKVTFQVWENGTRLSVHSANAPDRRLAITDQGFADTEFGDMEAGNAESRNRRWRVFSVWSGNFLVQVAETQEARDDISNELAGHLLAPLAIALPVLALTLALLIGQGLRPLSRLADDIGRRDANRLDPIVVANAPSELTPVLDRLNQLLARLGHSIEQERRFTADAAHELRTPLAAMRTHAQVAQGANSANGTNGAADAAARATALAHVIEATDRATHLVEQLLTLARVDAVAISSAFAPCDLHQLAAEAVALAAPAAVTKDIDIALTEGPVVEVKGEPTLLRVLLRNLVDNAVRYSPQKVGVSVTAGIDASGRRFVEIADQGPGIPPAERSRVLDRFYRVTGSSESGSGLGLSIAARIAELHGARLDLSDGPDGKGLCVRVVFGAAI